MKQLYTPCAQQLVIIRVRNSMSQLLSKRKEFRENENVMSTSAICSFIFRETLIVSLMRK